MEQGFLNRTSKPKTQKKDIGDSTKKTAPLLSNLAKKVQNIEGKMLGKDSKPMQPYRIVVMKSSLVETMSENRAEDGGVVHVAATGNTNDIHVTLKDENIGITSLAMEYEKNIVKVSSLTNEEKVLGADVAIRITAVDEICDQFTNTLYGYFIGSWLAFPIVKKYVCNAWAKYGFESVIVHNGFYLFKFTSHEGMVRVLNGGPWFIRLMHIMLNTWSANNKIKREDYTKILVWVKIHKNSVVVAIPLPKGSGHYLETLDVDTNGGLIIVRNENYLIMTMCFVLLRSRRFHQGMGILVVREACHLSVFLVGYYRLKKSRLKDLGSRNLTKVIYRPVSKPSQVTTNDTPFSAKEDANQVVDKPCGSHEASMYASLRVKGKSTYIQDDIDLGQLKEHMDRLMEENMILEFNTDVGTASKNSVHNTNDVSTSFTSAHVEVKGNVQGSSLEQFRQTKTSSTSDSDESEVEEVCMPDCIPGGGFLDDLEDELDYFDGYEAQIYDLTKQELEICDRFDIRLHSRCRK
uniref:DUF4283 domain-containing protein n=1 Tax=Tanacetum cinerariifolium TaxID=118510 RepID=A0A6L2LS61_TANCI|nr:hypothetical protein [Tanacetum cinerariifolium]